MRFVGYARVSTQDQNLDLQISALKSAGVQEANLFIEKASAAAKKRPELDRALASCREGDTFLVWRLDRLARSMPDLYGRLDKISKAGASFKSLTENFDCGTANGKFMLAVLGAVAEFERQIIAQRTEAGIAAYRAKHGARWGRLPTMTPERIAYAGTLLNSGQTGPQVAKLLSVSNAAIYKHWKRNGVGYIQREL